MAQATKANMDIHDYITLKTLIVTKREKGQPTGWEKIFSTCLYDKEFLQHGS